MGWTLGGIAGAILSAVFIQCWRCWQRWQQCQLVAKVLPVAPNFLHFASYFLFPGHADKPTKLYVRASVYEKDEGDVPGDKPSRRAYVHSAEVSALVELLKEVAPLPIDVQFLVGEDTWPVRSNFLFLGGDYHQPTARGVYDRLREVGVLKVPGALGESFEHYAYGDKIFGCKYREVGGGGGRKQVAIIEEDSGLIYRYRNDLEDEILYCAGIHMHGTAAALATAINSEFQRKIDGLGLTEFVQFVKVRVSTNGIAVDLRNAVWKDFEPINVGKTMPLPQTRRFPTLFSSRPPH